MITFSVSSPIMHKQASRSTALHTLCCMHATGAYAPVLDCGKLLCSLLSSLTACLFLHVLVMASTGLHVQPPAAGEPGIGLSACIVVKML